jgi:hypothetical protein
MWAAGGSRRQVPADAAASQLAGGPAFPLLPGNGAQPSPGPLVKIAQHRWCLAEAAQRMQTPLSRRQGTSRHIRAYDFLRAGLSVWTSSSRLGAMPAPKSWRIRARGASNILATCAILCLTTPLAMPLRRLARNSSVNFSPRPLSGSRQPPISTLNTSCPCCVILRPPARSRSTRPGAFSRSCRNTEGKISRSPLACLQ